MNYYAIYKTSTGEITQICITNNFESLSNLITNETNAVEISLEISDSTHYIDVNTNLPVLFPEKPSKDYKWDWNSKSWADLRPLDEVKKTKWEEIKLGRLKNLAKPLVTPYGIFDCNTVSRANIIQSVQYAQLTAINSPSSTVTFTLHDNSTISLNSTQMAEVGVLLGQHIEQVYTTARNLRQAITDASTINEVNVISWPI